jgi:hypothetical protein
VEWCGDKDQEGRIREKEWLRINMKQEYYDEGPSCNFAACALNEIEGFA